MTIETKYNIGDKVWFMHNNSVNCETIIKIDVFIERDVIYNNIFYHIYNYCSPYIEQKLFPTKEDLLKSL